MKARLTQARDQKAIPPAATARAITYAIEQPTNIDSGEMVNRPTAQA